MLKKIVFTSVAVVLVSIFFKEKSNNIIITIIKSVFIQSHENPSERLFTKDDLRLYNGKDKPELYLAILGNVFDVTRGAKHYGPNEQYHVFVGQDASRSFVTGNFDQQDVTDDVSDLSNENVLSLKNWLDFYEKEYTKVGKLIGTYFDVNGKLTPYGEDVMDRITKAIQEKTEEEQEKVKFPPCNVEWSQDTGTRVWCTDQSGGIKRDWTGVPRQYYETGSKSYRCACISEANKNLGTMKEYEGCAPTATSCYIKT